MLARVDSDPHREPAMMDDPSFGSSEYSPEAVELFAQYLLARDVGEDVDFEAFADEHADWTEELYGLHTDWDNVRGLLERLRVRPSPASAPAAEVGAPVAAAPLAEAARDA
ncbi:MAG: hypothetical protein H6828_00730 [Planctomycetes bacterium]|nr:hypothetical protein [Planctomycetota bacterium]